MKYFIVLILLIPTMVLADCPPSASELCNYQEGTFYHLDNIVGFSAIGGYSSNLSNQGAVNSKFVGISGNWDILLTNGVWISNVADYEDFFNPSYANDWWDYTLKLGYAFEPVYDYWSITPYIDGGTQTGQLYYSYNEQYNAGLGLRTEIALGTRNSVYADYNYQFILDSGGALENAYEQNFNADNAILNNQPYSNVIEVGYKHVFNCNTSMQVFYRYIGNSINLASSTPTVVADNYNAINMLGIGISFYTGDI